MKTRAKSPQTIEEQTASYLAVVAKVAGGVGDMSHRWAGLKYAWDAMLGQHSLGQNEDELIAFASELIRIVDEQLHAIQKTCEAELAHRNLAALTHIMKEVARLGIHFDPEGGHLRIRKVA